MKQADNFVKFYISTHSLTRRLTGIYDVNGGVNVFQLTASQGGWRHALPLESFAAEFQLTASQGGWQPQPYPSNTDSTFQLTASQGGWLALDKLHNQAGTFQLTASQGGWPVLHGKEQTTTKNFNSQPHKEADCLASESEENVFVFQLTASQGGWQVLAPLMSVPVTISTHSLTRRLTYSLICFVVVVGDFNSQPHKEADPMSSHRHTWQAISTHSLTRRLTTRTVLRHYINSYFNSQPHKEADTNLGNLIGNSFIFQLTASQGGWLGRTSEYRRHGHFNSQPHKEADCRIPMHYSLS